MSGDHLGTEHITDEDRAYAGSRFSEVRSALYANPYQQVWGAHGEPPLPCYKVTLQNVVRGILPLGRPYVFRQAAERVIDSKADLRWGPDRKGFRRLLHPNGICLTGMWRITRETKYSGYFRKGSDALIVGRYSTCCSETRRGHTRSLSLVGKLFPTTNADHEQPLHTANFITQQDIGGERTDYINDTKLRNAPNTTVWRRGVGTPILFISDAVFGYVDEQPRIRQLYEVAELGKPANEGTRAPQFMQLLVASEQPRIEGEALDFRDEIMAQIYDRGDPQPKRALKFHIEVTDDSALHIVSFSSDTGAIRRPGMFERRTFKNWRRIGDITFTEAIISYNGDFVVHFSHPTWRDDLNDPATATRVNERKVR
jgi:hypothetical protein